MEGMRYIITHPARKKWQQLRIGVTVARDRAEAKGRGCIAIARGEHPSVTGVEGSILGLIVEKDGMISGAKLFVVTEEQAGRSYTLNASRKLEEEVYEKKAC